MASTDGDMRVSIELSNTDLESSAANLRPTKLLNRRLDSDTSITTNIGSATRQADRRLGMEIDEAEIIERRDTNQSTSRSDFVQRTDSSILQNDRFWMRVSYFPSVMSTKMLLSRIGIRGG